VVEIVIPLGLTRLGWIASMSMEKKELLKQEMTVLRQIDFFFSFLESSYIRILSLLREFVNHCCWDVIKAKRFYLLKRRYDALVLRRWSRHYRVLKLQLYQIYNQLLWRRNEYDG
jgi:hypothetical protein